MSHGVPVELTKRVDASLDVFRDWHATDGKRHSRGARGAVNPVVSPSVQAAVVGVSDWFHFDKFCS